MPENTDNMPENNTTGGNKLSRNQILTLISTASLNFSSMICYSILGPFFPQEIVQVGAKFMFVVGLSVSGVSTILFGFLDKAPEGTLFIVMCFLVRSVDAVGFGASVTASFSILAKAFPNNIATAMGCLEIFTGLGLVLGPPIGGILYDTFGYEVPFITVGCVVLLMVPLNIFILPKYDSLPGKDSFWTLFKLPKIMLMCFNIFSFSSCLGFLDPTMSLFVTETFNLKVSYVGLVFLGLALSYSLSSPLLGVISDKLPQIRKWLVIVGNLGTAMCFVMLGPAPIFHIESKLWLFIFVLVLDGFCLGLSAIPVYPEMLSEAYENGFEEGLSTLGLISGLFSAMWSAGAFVGPTLGGFLNEKFHFKWAAASQGLLPLLAFVLSLLYYAWEAHKKKKRSSSLETNTTVEERVHLLQEE